jgi:hypothetical protein
VRLAKTGLNFEIPHKQEAYDSSVTFHYFLKPCTHNINIAHCQ